MTIILASITAFAISAVTGHYLVPALRRLKAGQSIREDGPTWHMGKQGTPTMGGLMFILAVAVSVLVFGWKEMMTGNVIHLFVLGFALLFGAIGFLDDWQKVKKKQNLGLTALQKFLLQVAASVVFLCLMRSQGFLSPSLYVPFFNVTWQLPWPVYMAFAAFVMVGAVNAVNITDGIDGLAASVTVPVAVFFTLLSVIWKGFTLQGIFAAALVGALLGFLLYNFYPAKVFMGDTGSLFLGGAVAALAFAYDMPLALALVGIIYIAETMSDILQVLYFKATHGKRLFKMAPLHHHFEMCGWSEIKIVCVFTVISTVFCALTTLGVFNRYIF